MVLVEQTLERQRKMTVRCRVRPGSLADWWCRFFDRRDLLEIKLLIFGIALLCGGMLSP